MPQRYDSPQPGGPVADRAHHERRAARQRRQGLPGLPHQHPRQQQQGEQRDGGPLPPMKKHFFPVTALSAALAGAYGLAQAQAEDAELAALTRPQSELSVGLGYWTKDRPRL